MCDLGFHICSACGEEYKCDQHNSECPVLDHDTTPCAKCEWWIGEEHKENERYQRMMQERKEWEREHGGYEK
jgi:hypothetical protein